MFQPVSIFSHESESHSVVPDSLWPHGLYSPWSSPSQNTGVGSLSLLQGIFPTQGSNHDLLHYRQILYHLSHKGSPRILESVAYIFSKESSRPRNLTEVSCIASGFFTNWAIREAQFGYWEGINRVLDLIHLRRWNSDMQYEFEPMSLEYSRKSPEWT